MDEELRLEISKIVSLAHGPNTVLPNLSPTERSPHCSSEDTHQPNTSQKRGPAKPPPKQKQTKPPPTHSKKNRKYQGMKACELHFRLRSDKLLEFCQEHELIAKKVICSCGNLMQLESKEISDDCEWTCYDKHHAVRPRQSVRKGTWFENSNLPIADILWIAYMWVHEYSSASMLHECKKSHKTLLDWYEFRLDVCQEILEHKRYPIGGEGKTVDIFECKIPNERKSAERWAFCGIEQNSTNSLELLLENKNSDTVFKIFEKYILPGTKMVTHNWAPYKNLHQGDFAYLIHSKSICFFDTLTKKNLETFQDLHRATNRPPKGLNKWTKFEYGPSFFEKMYRKSLIFASDAYLTFLNDISMLYKPVEELVSTSSMEEDE